MTIQQVERELMKFNCGAMVINESELMKALHKGRKAVKELTEGLTVMEGGRSREFFVKDVAHRLRERMQG